ncbi:NYN domain-containing protein [Sphingomonas sp. ZB1N12]|uniref:NYN domain-containing protein n=1 Tax=Sphingomonas arabinosi TaxID=3096160 RepID=UPI002FCB9B33
MSRWLSTPWTSCIRAVSTALRLASSDSDFTRLAARIREQGVEVFGFGETKTPASFR